MVFLWLIAGSLLVSIPFYLFSNPYDLWPSVYAGGIAAAIYLTAFLLYMMKSNVARKLKFFIIALMAIFFLTSVIHWTTMDAMSRYQRSTLGKIRTVISQGVLMNEDATERAVSVFVTYQKQTGAKKGIVPLFKEKYGRMISNGMFVSERPMDDATKRYVDFYADTAVVLVSIDTVARGKNDQFANRNGGTGKLQTTTTLTTRGVKYERNN